MDPEILARIAEAVSDPVTAVVVAAGVYFGIRAWRGGSSRADRAVQGVIERVDQLQGSIVQMQGELGEVHERLDFAERMLTKGRDEA